MSNVATPPRAEGRAEPRHYDLTLSPVLDEALTDLAGELGVTRGDAVLRAIALLKTAVEHRREGKVIGAASNPESLEAVFVRFWGDSTFATPRYFEIFQAIFHQEGMKADVQISSPEDPDEKRLRLLKERWSFYVKELGPYAMAAVFVVVMSVYGFWVLISGLSTSK
jgi:hypothetical protein